MRRTAILVAVLAAGLCAGGGAALAESAPSGPPPAWDKLIPCAQKADPAEGFACYQAAMKAAGYVPDNKAVAEDRRRTFGLPNLLRRSPEDRQAKAEKAPKPEKAPKAAPAAPEDSEDLISVQLAEIAFIPPANKMLMVMSDGAVWEQTDSQQIRPFPRSGQPMTIRRTKFGGYFCQFDRVNAVRCIRKH